MPLLFLAVLDLARFFPDHKYPEDGRLTSPFSAIRRQLLHERYGVLCRFEDSWRTFIYQAP